MFHYLKFIVFFLLSFPLWSLDLQENLLAVVLKIYPENIIAFSRGVEDGVKFQDHIKITSSNVFIARAVCVKTLPKVSFWKIYRTTKNSLQMAQQYKITSIPLSEVRPAVLREISSIKLDFLNNETQENLLKKE
jgi:hypothetical protein